MQKLIRDRTLLLEYLSNISAAIIKQINEFKILKLNEGTVKNR